MLRQVQLFVLFGMVVVLLLVIFVFVQKPEPVLGVESEFKMREAAAGSSLEFKTIIINPDNVVMNVTLLHELVLGNTLIGQKRVAVRVEKTQEFSQSFPVASTVKPAKYILRTTAYFDDVRAEVEANITVLPAETTVIAGVEKSVLEEIGVVIPEEERTEELTQTQISKPKTSGKKISPVMLVQAETKEDCAKAPDVRSRDFCYAQFASDPSVCELIESEDLKSWCSVVAEFRVS